jgi:hypothetical protein
MSNVPIQNWLLNRRHFLRGLGATLGTVAFNVPLGADNEHFVAARLFTASDAAELHKFARGVFDYVVAHHVRPDGEMTGKLYEYYVPSVQRWVTLEGQDEVHDAMWLVDACVQAVRATGDAGFLKPWREQMMPYYLKTLLESEKLFGLQKGACPFWWDDGASLYYNDGTPARGWSKAHLNERGGLNHMKSDLGIGLLSYWIATRDSRAAEAALAVDADGRARWGVIPMCAIAAGISNGRPELYKQIGARKFNFQPWPKAEYYRGFYLGEKVYVAPFFDDGAWEYAMQTIHDGRFEMNEEFAAGFLFMVYQALAVNDLWWDDAKPQPGLNQWEGGDRLIENRAFARRHSQWPDYPQGTRLGTQLLWASAVGLQLLDAFRNAVAIWKERLDQNLCPPQYRLTTDAAVVRGRLERELQDGLGFWRGVFEKRGFVPPFVSGRLPWKRGKTDLPDDWLSNSSEIGGAGHLIAALAQAINLANGKRDWDLVAEALKK